MAFPGAGTVREPYSNASATRESLHTRLDLLYGNGFSGKDEQSLQWRANDHAIYCNIQACCNYQHSDSHIKLISGQGTAAAEFNR
jgi:hypothetical protein